MPNHKKITLFPAATVTTSVNGAWVAIPADFNDPVVSVKVGTRTAGSLSFVVYGSPHSDGSPEVLLSDAAEVISTTNGAGMIYLQKEFTVSGTPSVTYPIGGLGRYLQVRITSTSGDFANVEVIAFGR